MDKLLTPYLNSKDEFHTQHNLEELLAVYATPIVRRTMRRRLGFYVSAQGINQQNQDAEDLFQETMTKIVQRLSELRTDSSSEIENFKQYVSRITTNMCIDFLRAKSPARAHLKDSVRELLRRHPDLASWQDEGELVCGLSQWRSSNTIAVFDDASRSIESTSSEFIAARFSDSDIQSAPLSNVVIELLSWIDGPVRLEDLVKVLVSLLHLREPEYESIDELDPSIIDSSAFNESGLEAVEMLMRLWQALQSLPREQRDVFVFGFEDQAGRDLFTALLLARVATVKELAEVLGMTVEEVIRLRLEMPMDAKSIAKKLNTSRTNVSKWRFRALQRLRIELSNKIS
jgi:RNA polymerase sigma factor (sigma-70 family)